jgi:hypothetical protein
MMMNSRYRVLAPVIFLVLSSCAADTEADAPGSCSLSCSQPRVAASNFKLERLNSFDPSGIYCNADFTAAGKDILPANGPIAVRFRVYETVTLTLPAGGGEGGGEGGNGGGSGEASGAAGSVPILETVPRGGIGFEPLLYGGLAVEQTNPEHLVNPTTASPFKFAGVVTPKAEWCSDTCGNITYEFWPYCRQDGQMNVDAGVQVEGIPFSDPYRISVTNN